MKKMTKNYKTLLQRITRSEDVTKYWVDDIELELNKFFKVLTRKEEIISKYLYGFYDDKLKTYEEVAEVFGITAESVKNLDYLVLKKLRFIFNLNNLEFIFNPDNIIDTTKILLKDQQAYDDYYATSMPPKESSSTKFYKQVIEVAESFKKDDKEKKRALNK